MRKNYLLVSNMQKLRTIYSLVFIIIILKNCIGQTYDPRPTVITAQGSIIGVSFFWCRL